MRLQKERPRNECHKSQDCGPSSTGVHFTIMGNLYTYALSVFLDVHIFQYIKYIKKKEKLKAEGAM